MTNLAWLALRVLVAAAALLAPTGCSERLAQQDNGAVTGFANSLGGATNVQQLGELQAEEEQLILDTGL